MKVQLGQKIYIPSHDVIAVVSKIDGAGVPYEAKYLTTDGKVNVVDLITTTWELITLIRQLINAIKSLFKRN